MGSVAVLQWDLGANRVVIPKKLTAFLARDVIYTSRAYATISVSVCLSVCLSMMEVHWRIIANLSRSGNLPEGLYISLLALISSSL